MKLVSLDALSMLQSSFPLKRQERFIPEIDTAVPTIEKPKLRVTDLFLEQDGLSEGMHLGGCVIECGMDKAKDVITPFQTHQPEAIAVV